MLPAGSRLRRSADFAAVLQRSRATVRARSATIVVHLLVPDSMSGSSGPAQVGFLVPRTVGGAVVRTRTKRQLRHLARERLSRLPPDARVVVRALPGAGAAATAELSEDLDRALAGVLRRLPTADPSGMAAGKVRGSRGSANSTGAAGASPESP